jgi:Zn-dependent metalloprotease
MGLSIPLLTAQKKENPEGYINKAFTIDQQQTATGFLNSLQEKNNDFSFSNYRKETDDIGITHSRYHVLYKGIPVFGDFLVTHEDNGLLNHANGRLSAIQTKGAFSTPTTTVLESSKATIANYWKQCTVNEIEVDTSVRLFYYPKNNIIYAAYCIRATALTQNLAADFYFDATSGKFIESISAIHGSTAVPTTLPTYYSGNVNTTVEQTSTNEYVLKDMDRNIVVKKKNDFIYSNNNTWSAFDTILDKIEFYQNGVLDNYFGQAIYINECAWKSLINTKLPMFRDSLVLEREYCTGGCHFSPLGNRFGLSTYPITQYNFIDPHTNNSCVIKCYFKAIKNYEYDVYYGLQKTYDYYLNTFNYKGYDNNGSLLTATCYSTKMFNAYWYDSPPGNIVMAYNDSSEYFTFNRPFEKAGPASSQEIVGHEFTHGVTQFTAGLVYRDESGALNEGFSDMLGEMVNYSVTNTSTWCNGTKPFFGKDTVRTFSNPKLQQCPNTYKGQYWNNYGGEVHFQSGVFNYWFYLLSEGGIGKNDNNDSFYVSGIGKTKTAKLAFETLRYHLGPTSNYYDAFLQTVNRGKVLFGLGSNEVDQIINAWYAVGVASLPANAFCKSETFTLNADTFSDGSGFYNYPNDQYCSWLIRPTGARAITINFHNFHTELLHDSVFVYKQTTTSRQLIGAYSGTLPDFSVNISSGSAVVIFQSDHAVTDSGFVADYTSDIDVVCNGKKIVAQPTGSFTDGSGPGKTYSNNLNCEWLIAPPCASSVTLTFDSFGLEPFSYDKLTLNDDSKPLYNLLGSYSGFTLPAAVTSSTGRIDMQFISLYSNTFDGFQVHYTSDGQPAQQTIILTAPNDTFSDGSGAREYCNNIDYSWKIEAGVAKKIRLSFDQLQLYAAPFQEHTINDMIMVYDGADTTAPLLMIIGGNAQSHTPIISTGNNMLVRFITNEENTADGFAARYSTSYATDIQEANTDLSSMFVANKVVYTEATLKTDIKIVSMDGKVVKEWQQTNGKNRYDISDLSNGVYLLYAHNEKQNRTLKFIQY